MNKKIYLICATTHDEESFYKNALLGKFFSKTIDSDVGLLLYPSNSIGLATVYNDAIKKIVDDDSVLVFIHDDAYILDLYWKSRLLHSLEELDLVGIAGSTVFGHDQPAWCVSNTRLDWISNEYLRGMLYHGDDIDSMKPTIFNETVGNVRIIDGVFISIKKSTINKFNLYFDELFAFHMYDTDFCRQANRHKLRIGVVDISLLHASAGKVSSEWYSSANQYLDKWKNISL